MIMKIDWDDNNLILSFLEESSLFENEITDDPSDDTVYNILANAHDQMFATTDTESVQKFLKKYWNNKKNFDTIDFKKCVPNEKED